jgi:hypothetical protein
MYLVRCRAANGRTVEQYVNAPTGDAACRVALAILDRTQPGMGWRAEWAI